MEDPICPDGGDPRLVGDPVDTLTGAVVDRMLDFRLTGPIELRWYRHYDSLQSHRRFSVGRGSAHDYDRTLRFDADSLVYEEPVGRAYKFPRLSNDGNSSALHGFILYRISSLCYVMFRHAQPAMEFVFPPTATRARLSRLYQGASQIAFIYDSRQRLVGIEDSVGRYLTTTEDAEGRLVQVAMEASPGSPEYALISYFYDDAGNLISTQDSGGHGYRFAYDEANRMTLRRGRTGFEFYFKYDAEARCISASGENRLYGVALAYPVAGRVTKMTRADNGVWIYRFTTGGGLEAIHDPLGGVRKFVRDASGQVAFEVDPNGNTIQFVYDGSGHSVAKIDSFGRRIALPEQANVSDPLGHRIAANPAEYEYGRLLDIKRITLPSATQIRALPLTPQARSAAFIRSHKAPPLTRENQFEVRPPDSGWWPEPKNGWNFNEKGQLSHQLDEHGHTRHWRYDAVGNIAEHTDFDGGRWVYNAGPWFFRQELVNPLGYSIAFTYTAYGQVASFTDASGVRSEYSYDLKDYLVEVKRHGVVRETYDRDAVGNLVAKYAGDGELLLRLWIGPGNLPLTRTLSSGEKHNFHYDKAGRMLLASSVKDRIAFAYDALGDRVLEKRNGLGVEHHFQEWHKPSESVLFDRFKIRYTRAGNSLVITDPGDADHTIRFQGNGLVQRSFSNGSLETVQYDNIGRCLFKCVDRGGDQPWIRRFHWSGESELRRVDDTIWGEVRHDYDAAHRLRRRHIEGRIEHYVMDRGNNLLAQPGLDGVTLLEGNRLGGANAGKFAYDVRNHVKSRQKAKGETRYLYDSRDQLVRVEMPEGVWEAEYDALGRRTRKIWDRRTTEYYWSSDQLVAEVNHDGMARLYIYVDLLALTPFLMLDYASLDAPLDSCRRSFIFADQIGTPCLIEDVQQKDLWSARIAPFGQAEIMPGAKVAFNLRFPGHYADAELGLHYNRFRYYDPLLGRYLQSDPWGVTGGPNLYGYCPNPLYSVDVRGLGEPTSTDKSPKEGGPEEEGANGAAPAAEETPPEPAATRATEGMGGRVLSPAEQAEFDAFAQRAQSAGLQENPKRTGSWGAPGANGKYKETARIDVGEAGKNGYQGETHMHVDGQKDHLPLTTSIPGEK